jgi:hypothetical protein
MLFRKAELSDVAGMAQLRAKDWGAEEYWREAVHLRRCRSREHARAQILCGQRRLRSEAPLDGVKGHWHSLRSLPEVDLHRPRNPKKPEAHEFPLDLLRA